jgi:two-component sensor histidine kinase/CheY-like chemotaxis protein
MRAVDIVEDAGFNSVEAVNSEDALAILEARSDIDLLFTDIQMPGPMNGLKLAHAVHERWPSIKIILVSGQVTPTEGNRPPDSRFFGKPLEVQQMITELQGMIGRGALEIVPGDNPSAAVASGLSERTLTAENGSLRLLLEQAEIDAITLQSLRTAISIEHGQQAIDSRLAALGQAHDLLMKAEWANASFIEIVRGATEPYDSEAAGKFTIEGPEIKIASAAVIAFAMTLNELCTNTTKFGALSVPTGRVDIHWRIDEQKRRVIFTWTESGGPLVYAPVRRSFGTRLMGSLGQQLKGEVQLTYNSAGFAYALDVPLSAIVATG